ncbi:MAG: peptide chain release factor 1, partial [bacterium]|nr:peptide chain release factor 1 [bacterium]
MSFLRPRVRQRLDAMVARVAELTARSADPSTPHEQLATLQRELGRTAPAVERYKNHIALVEQIDEHKLLVDGDDRELAELARSELPDLEEQAQAEAEELLDLLLAGQGDDSRDCIVEIRAGTGGEEASLFARDLVTLYQRFAQRRGWTFQPLDSTPTEQGGFKEVVFQLKGSNVFHEMQFESGGHRVQRVPETEARGRVHTSACTVAVLPEVEEVEVHIDQKDLRVDTYRSSGAGGQHVNKTDSAVRITHLPTNTVVTCQEERSQIKNRSKAMTMLRSRIYEQQRRQQEAERAAERREQVGTGDRSDRIRTYNYPQNRVTDHRLGLTLHKLDQVVEGDLDEVFTALRTDFQAT